MSNKKKSFFRNIKPEFEGKTFSEIEDNFFKKKSHTKTQQNNSNAKSKPSLLQRLKNFKSKKQKILETKEKDNLDFKKNSPSKIDIISETKHETYIKPKPTPKHEMLFDKIVLITAEVHFLETWRVTKD